MFPKRTNYTAIGADSDFPLNFFFFCAILLAEGGRIMEELNWGDRPVTALPGVGRVKAGHFGKLGIQTIADLLYHFPRGYQNRGAVCLLGEASMTPCSTSTILTVGSKPSSVRLKGNRVMTRFTAFDDSGKCIITFFTE